MGTKPHNPGVSQDKVATIDLPPDFPSKPARITKEDLLQSTLVRQLTMGKKPQNPGASHDEVATIDLPPDFLSKPARITKQNVDWKKTDLPEYDGLFATVLDNCFTPAECKTLVSMAEASSNGVWLEAMINVGGGRQEFNPYARDCGRIILDDRRIVQKIWDRVKAEVPEIVYLINMPRVTGNGPAKRKEVWKLSRLNERMRFLKYGEGQYFKPHMDGCYVTPDCSEYTFYTLHLYLNDTGQDKIGGGATTFHSMNMQRQFDVEPKTGRVLIFQHRDLLHSGADVTSGIKLTLRTDLLYRKEPVEEYT